MQNALISVIFFNKVGAFQADCIYLEGGSLNCSLRVYSNLLVVLVLIEQ